MHYVYFSTPRTGEKLFGRYFVLNMCYNCCVLGNSGYVGHCKPPYNILAHTVDIHGQNINFVGLHYYCYKISKNYILHVILCLFCQYLFKLLGFFLSWQFPFSLEVSYSIIFNTNYILVWYIKQQYLNLKKSFIWTLNFQ